MPPQTSPLVYIVLLNWNGWRDTIPCVESLRRLSYPNYRIVVVDNNSPDESEARIRAACPDVTVLQSGANLGFAGGNNAGIRFALAHGAEYVWLLNNDTLVDPDALGALVRRAEADPRVGLAGSKILYASQPGIVWFAGGVVKLDDGTAGASLIDVPDDDRLPPAHETMFVCGCSLLARRRLIEEVGGLDATYFLYYEDTDWCFRASRQGWKVMYEPSSVVYHKVSASIGTFSPVQTFHSARSRTIFVRRHLSRTALRRSLWLSARSFGLRHFARARWRAGMAGLRGLLSGLRAPLDVPPRLADRDDAAAERVESATPSGASSHATRPTTTSADHLGE